MACELKSCLLLKKIKVVVVKIVVSQLSKLGDFSRLHVMFENVLQCFEDNLLKFQILTVASFYSIREYALPTKLSILEIMEALNLKAVECM